MIQCSICLENKIPELHKNFNCNCSIFVCNKCSNKLEELIDQESIYSICPQCRDRIPVIYSKTTSSKNIKDIYNKIINSDIFDFIIGFICWIFFFELIGYLMINYINFNHIVIHTERMNILLFLFIQFIIGSSTFISIWCILMCYFYIICIL